MKGTESAESKIPLLFMENDVNVNKWIQIELDFLQYKLPGNKDKLPDPAKDRRSH